MKIDFTLYSKHVFRYNYLKIAVNFAKYKLKIGEKNEKISRFIF